MLACEPGLLSMRGSNVPTFQAFEGKLIDSFFDWWFSDSKEINNFDTLAIDSASEMCDIYLKEAEKTNKHGLAAYGEMARIVSKHLNKLYFMPNKHAYIVAKQEIISDNGFTYKRPYYPGKQLPVEMPHKFDNIIHVDIYPIPGVGQVKAFRCLGTIDTMARDRSGLLNEYEEPHFGKLVLKVMK